MRLNKGNSITEIQELSNFAQWVLDIGDGKVSPPLEEIPYCGEDDILIPLQFCDIKSENSVDNMIHATYPDFINKCKDPKYLSERAILTPTNQTVGHLNSLIVEKLPGESFSYLSIDTAEEFGGLCNDTKMIVTKCLKFCVECDVICGAFVGTRHFIPHMELAPSETRMPFKLVRKQMHLQICYAMTINKAQGQSLETVGLYLLKSCFTHGQFYIAISRVTSPGGLKIFVDDEAGQPTNITQNVVYKEIFYSLPKP
ncbi:uncharacterized protein LOC141695378 [Apium graveolens]|uniref:uncharacterized protein LOC141695378 n=1 Tax=Apium graveolens TaxID=4045 RepID=UPI003D7A6BA5